MPRAASPGPSFSLQGHGSPASSSSTPDTDEDVEDDEDFIPAGQPVGITVTAEALGKDENPFLGAGFPPHLRGPGDGFASVPRRRTPGGAIGEEAPVAPAGDQNQFKALMQARSTKPTRPTTPLR